MLAQVNKRYGIVGKFLAVHLRKTDSIGTAFFTLVD